MFVGAVVLLAQGPIGFQYFYDDLNQLIKVIDSTGVVIDYSYDAVGNITQIKRSTPPAGALSVFNFTPQQGGPGTSVTTPAGGKVSGNNRIEHSEVQWRGRSGLSGFPDCVTGHGARYCDQWPYYGHGKRTNRYI